MYTDRNFKTKKELKAAVDAWNAGKNVDSDLTPKPVTYHQPGPFGGNEPQNGEFSVEGPHYPQPHKWYARVTARDGVIVKVR